MRFFAAFLLSIPAFPAMALENQIIYNPQGTAVFEVRFFDKDDGPFAGDPDIPDDAYKSSWNQNAQQKEKVLAALGYWAEIIKPQPGHLPAIINVGTYDDEGASGGSSYTSYDPSSLTKLQAALQGEDPGERDFGSDAQFALGKMPFETIPYMPSQLPRSSDTDLAAVAFHELAHGLGILSGIDDWNDKATPYFGPTIGSWAEHLRDDNGRPSRPSQAVLCSKCNNPYDPDAFDVRKDQGYFAGDRVNEVLVGAMPGVPVNILAHTFAGDFLDPDYMSHSELKNSLMSHQSYRNYTNFMEAELAALQDMGYTIDRRNFYGYSIYGDGKTLVNDHGFFLRNTEGTAYIPGRYNIATLGLGLHIHGSHSEVVQRADLLTMGAGGAGVRIDGEDNGFTVRPGTRIYADGINGRGVMFTYGKDHDFIQRGDIQALGEGGIAASFDFGNNILGNNRSEYRGSFIDTFQGQPIPLLDELNGALVDEVYISGRLAGSQAAIYISSNALVNRINVLRGARLEGDTISLYDQQDENGKQRLTEMTFGLLADEDGIAIDDADPRFTFIYNDDIKGITNLKLKAAGGYTELNGNHQIYGMEIVPGATLAGSSNYKLNDAGSGFVNNGAVTPGGIGSIGRTDIVGGYTQESTGELLIDVSGKDAYDVLTVSGNAALDGRLTLALAPTRGWYANGWTIGNIRPLRAGSITGAFGTVEGGQLTSPTLTLQASPQGADSYQLTIDRKANAYSQYGRDDNTRQAGQALDKIVAQAGPGMQPLYSALDFSATDGSTVASALNVLSPAGYSAMFAASVDRERQITDSVTSGALVAIIPQAGKEGGWRAFAVPFGSGFDQKRGDAVVGYDGSGYGLVFGAERQAADYPDLVLGFHGAFSQQTIVVKAPETGKGEVNAFDLGLHARYAEDPLAGVWLSGLARMGIEDASMTRPFSFNGYSGRGEADWTGYSTTLAAAGGYRWALSGTISLGPVAGLSFTHLSRPYLTEHGDAGRLWLGETDFNSLRSSLGMNGSFDVPLPSGSMVKASAQLTWDHELLNKELAQEAGFAGYPGAGFETRKRIGERDAFRVQAGLSYDVSADLTLAASIGSTLSRAGHDLSGTISATLRF
ncbi:outer membrane autotransporter [Paramesorhizobium deserti]|uniref:Outer membrane autotransporter n=1 Tax=Paramesorhizobium deserti TaxID=1494590 RepID=A0A135HQ39_9HYPH|nr:autotransporter outer membrane beta-barrel domain-containing protein [Paramesorhizobium deserti]KXF75318.1 outer membrane autotransporter [Paramesorhizobium deserti]